jgi:hypothetical protein
MISPSTQSQPLDKFSYPSTRFIGAATLLSRWCRSPFYSDPTHEGTPDPAAGISHRSLKLAATGWG